MATTSNRPDSDRTVLEKLHTVFGFEPETDRIVEKNGILARGKDYLYIYNEPLFKSGTGHIVEDVRLESPAS